MHVYIFSLFLTHRKERVFYIMPVRKDILESFDI